MIFRIVEKVGISRPDLVHVGAVALAKRGAVASLSMITVIAVLLGVRYLGGLEPLELMAFDHLVRLRSKKTVPDPRILLITITEKDIRDQKKWPFSDQVVAQLLRKLQAMQPAVIGLDLYRDIPIEPGHNELVAQLKQPNALLFKTLIMLPGQQHHLMSHQNELGLMTWRSTQIMLFAAIYYLLKTKTVPCFLFPCV